jgi:hypothetical protein
LTDAVTEAKSINTLIYQNKLKMMQLKENLEQKTLPVFLPINILEQRMREQNAISAELGVPLISLDEATLGKNHKIEQKILFN